MDAILVYMTASSVDEAERIGAHLVEKRLAACVNVLGDIRSMYWWAGAVQNETETAFVAKTERSCFKALAAAVREVHSYDTPCIVALPMIDGDSGFLRWLHESIAPD